MSQKVAVGLSGGVDSSFAAWLLTKQGYSVVGFTLKLFPAHNRCCDSESLAQAKCLCDYLHIPHFILDAKELFRKEIIDYFIEGYAAGRTPNPCSFCNRLIKFGYFFDKIKSFGIDKLATGHYVRLARKNNGIFFQKAKDTKKSQEYFLSLVRPIILEHLLFPLGGYTKEEVKKEAYKQGIIFKEREESQDVCFITGSNYAHFVAQHAATSVRPAGPIKHVEGDVLGTHQGIYQFTRGQREGLGIAWGEPLYVVDIDSDTNTIFVGERRFLYKKMFTVSEINWFADPADFKKIKVKVRYNAPSYNCRLQQDNGSTTVFLGEGIDAVTPGQVATFYGDDVVVGGGIIEK